MHPWVCCKCAGTVPDAAKPVGGKRAVRGRLPGGGRVADGGGHSATGCAKEELQQASQWIALQGRRIIGSVGSALTELFPKRIHATTLKGFVLKVWGFIFAHNFKRLASVL